MTRADPGSLGEIAQCKAKVIPKRADGALAAHDGESYLVGDAAAVICFESGQPVFELIVAGYQSVVLRRVRVMVSLRFIGLAQRSCFWGSGRRVRTYSSCTVIVWLGARSVSV